MRIFIIAVCIKVVLIHVFGGKKIKSNIFKCSSEGLKKKVTPINIFQIFENSVEAHHFLLPKLLKINSKCLNYLFPNLSQYRLINH